MDYAGIGARKTPPGVLGTMERLAGRLAAAGWTLRSGGAQGADSAFARGAGLAMELYRPEHLLPDAAFDVAASHHPAWDRCNDYVRRLHARNVLIVLGPGLDDPVRFVACWTPDGEAVGGTGLGLRIAATYSVPVFNLARPGDAERIAAWLG